MTAQALTLRDPRLVYRCDAGLSLAMGFGLVILAGPLATLIGWAPMEVVLVGAGIFLFPWAFFNWTIGAAMGPDRLSLAVNMAGDTLWSVASLALLVLHSAQMTPIGVTLIAAQAVFVGGVGAIKWRGRNSFDA